MSSGTMQDQRGSTMNSVHDEIGEDTREEFVSHIKHMTGCASNVPRKLHGFRNFFVAETGSDDCTTLLIMASYGLVRIGSTTYDNRTTLFHATEKGCRFAGLSGPATRQAMDGR